jgi:hypothetical protein
MSAFGTRAPVQNAAPGAVPASANPSKGSARSSNVSSIATARADHHWQIAEAEWRSLYGATITDTFAGLLQRHRADPSNKEAEDQLDISLWRARRLAKQFGVVDRLDAIITEVSHP